jgi:parallel beta-helix repeat protein
MKTSVIPSNGMVVTEDTQLASGVYFLPDGIKIGADHITLEGDNTLIVSNVQEKVGISAENHHHVTIRNLAISGFYHGIRMDNCRQVTLENLNIRNTWEIAGIETFLYLWLPIEKVYGGAVLLNQVQNAALRGCDLQHQQNGFLLYGCEAITVENSNASFNSGWGIYLYNTNHSRILDNHFDFCNRLYRRPEDGSIRAEADTAGIVLVKGSSYNIFQRNTCIGGGDGIFLCGYEHPGVFTPCNHNLFEDNDCRLSPNNAVESTFSQGNIYRRNDCSRSNYAFWMGYSWDNIIEDNLIEFSRWAGIAIEHGFDFTIRNNRIRLNGEGIRLFTRGGPVIDHFPDRRVSFNYTIEGNLFESNTLAFNGYTGAEIADQDCHDFHLRNNRFVDNRVGVQFERVQRCVVEDNIFSGNVETAIRLKGKPGVEIGANHYENNAQDRVDM